MVTPEFAGKDGFFGRRRGDGIYTSHANEEFNLKDYLNILRRRKGAVILFFLVTVIAVTVYSFTATPVYRATATLLIDMESPNVLTATGTVTLDTQSYYSYKEYYQSQQEMLTSLGILRAVYNEFSLGSTKDYAESKEPLKDFAKTVKVESVRDTRLLKLHVDNKDPELAAKIANRIAQVYVKRNLYYVSRNELMNLLKNEYLKLEARLVEYSKTYKWKHPKMIRLKQEMAEMSKRIDGVKKLSFKADIAPEELEGYDKYMVEGFKANNVSIQDAADTPLVPIRPKKRLDVLLATIVGLFGGIGLAFFFEYMDDTIKESEHVGRMTAWPLLGNVPIIGMGSKISELEKDVFVHTKPQEPAAEAYRSIRTSVLFSATDEHPLKAIVLTSPGPQEGKTTTLCNLGIAMAQNQKKVLLVDADMRKSRLHDVFKKENDKGLSTFLSSQAGFESLIRKTDIENISVVTSGPHPPNPSELISSHKMKDFIELVRKKFDFILFDTPPVAMLTDAVILSGFADGIIMVVQSGKTSKKALSRVHQVLKDAKVRVVGTVFNMISIASSHYYYYSYYGKRK
jgi:capsular exopolysaccharide synthesis family protein